MKNVGTLKCDGQSTLTLNNELGVEETQTKIERRQYIMKRKRKLKIFFYCRPYKKINFSKEP